MTHADFQEMLPLHAACALEGNDQAAFEGYVRANAERCHAELLEWSEVTARLASEGGIVSPRGSVWRNIEHSTITDRGIVKQIESTPSTHRFLPWALAACLAAGLFLSLFQGGKTTRKLAKAESNLATLEREKKSLEADLAKLETDSAQTQQQLEAKIVTIQAEAAVGIAGSVDRVQAERDEWRNRAMRLDAETSELAIELGRRSDETSAAGKRATDSYSDMDFIISPDVQIVTLQNSKGVKGSIGKIFWNDRSRQGLVALANVPPVLKGSGHCLQLWAMSVGRPSTPAGVGWTDVRGKAMVRMNIAGLAGKIDQFAITIEPGTGGSRPTGPTILTGKP